MEHAKSGLKFSARSLPWALGIAFGVLAFVWLYHTPAGLLGKADALGYAVCHRIDLRSFSINGRPMPLCARCTGMYLGAITGLVYQFIVGGRRMGMPPRRVIAVLGLLVLAFAVDGLNSYLTLFPNVVTLYQPQNWMRLLTGMGMGVVLSAGLVPSFNQTVWSEWDGRPALSGFRSLSLLILAGLGLSALVLLNDPWILFTLSLVSAAGILVVLGMVYIIVLLILFRRDNTISQTRGLYLPALGGLFLALLQIGLIDLARFWLTGTWDGFHFG
jgi:uncharacterized membrane protein